MSGTTEGYGENLRKTGRKQRETTAVHFPSKTMSNTNPIIVNDVNGNSEGESSSGRDGHVRQVAPDRHPATVRIPEEQFIRASKNDQSQTKTIATWNVRTMAKTGSLENVKREMNRLKINILGLSEVRWQGAGSVNYDGYRIIYSGGEKCERGVGFILDSQTAKTVKGFWSISDRVILIKLRGQPFDIGIIQVYAPTSSHTDAEIDAFYGEIETALKQLKSQDVKIIMGDLNAKVGESRIDSTVGPFGLGEINERGERLVDWCKDNDLVICNTWFPNHPRRRWTWMSPGDRTRNQIDYFMIQHRFRNSVRSAKSMPGADCDSDHVPVVCSVRIKLKKVHKSKVQPKYHVDYLTTNDTMKEQYSVSVKNKFDALSKITSAREKYEVLKQCIIESVQENIPVVTRKQHKKWITEEILNLMETRRKSKNDVNKYKEINRSIKKKCNEAKEKWLNDKCGNIEIANHTNDPKSLHQEIKEISGKRMCSQTGCIKAKDGSILIDKDAILARWSEYVQELFYDERGGKPAINKAIEGPSIMQEEVECALKKLRKGKATGPDNISVELLEALGDWGTDTITDILNRIYDSGEIPVDMCKSIFIMIPKKPGANECGLHRTISLMSHLTKLLLRILLLRMKSKIRPEISSHQFGFMADTGTRNAIFSLSTLIDRSLEMQKDVFICFIDYAKAFDKVRHEKLLKTLGDLDIDGKDIRLIRNLYWEQIAATRIDGEMSEFKHIQRGVRQGCVLSPDFFNLYSEMIFREIEDMKGINIGGRNVNNLRYADDTALIADSERNLQNILNVVAKKSEQMGLMLNVKKTECMVISRNDNTPSCNLDYKGELVKQVNQFIYLGHMITSDGRCIQEIKRRISMAKDSYRKFRPIMNNRNIESNTKIRIIKTYVWSVLLYGSECWKINKECERRIAASEMWFYRRMLNIKWQDRISNQQVLSQIGLSTSLVQTIRRRQLHFLGHLYRKDGIEREILVGRIDGKRARGRQRTSYLGNLIEWTNEENRQIVPFLRRADDRETWRAMVADVCNRPGTT